MSRGIGEELNRITRRTKDHSTQDFSYHHWLLEGPKDDSNQSGENDDKTCLNDEKNLGAARGCEIWEAEEEEELTMQD
jgi:hypothetical protein